MISRNERFIAWSNHVTCTGKNGVAGPSILLGYSRGLRTDNSLINRCSSSLQGDRFQASRAKNRCAGCGTLLPGKELQTGRHRIPFHRLTATGAVIRDRHKRHAYDVCIIKTPGVPMSTPETVDAKGWVRRFNRFFGRYSEEVAIMIRIDPG